MNRTIISIERAAAARERMNQQCRTTEFRKFGAQMHYKMGDFDTFVPSPLDVQPYLCNDHEERRRMKAAVTKLREAMYEWTCLCEEKFGLTPAFDDAAWEAIEQQITMPSTSGVLAELDSTGHTPIHIDTIVLEQHNHGVLPLLPDNDLNLLTNG